MANPLQMVLNIFSIIHNSFWSQNDWLNLNLLKDNNVIGREMHSVELDRIPCYIAVLATSTIAIYYGFKIIYGKFEKKEMTFIFNFDQFEVIFF